MLRNIHADLFFFYAGSQRREDPDNTGADQCADNSYCYSNYNTDDLSHKKPGFAEYKAIPLSYVIDGRLGEKSCGNTAPDTADTMAAKSVQSIINLEPLFNKRYTKAADGTYQKANDKG